jgi:hypothetical protein
MKTSVLDAQDLRNTLLFFDELVWPTNNFIHISGGGAEYDFLTKAGVLRRVAAAVETSGNMSDISGASVRKVFIALEAENSGCWAINNGENSVKGAADRIANSRGALVRLTNAIPIPHGDVGLEDLLRFRERRRAELLALRVRLEELYQVIEAAPDQSMAWSTQTSKMTAEINDCLAAARESGLPWRWGSLEWSISLSATAGAALAATLAGQSWEAALNLATNAAIPSLGISGSVGFGREAGLPKPWKYIASIHNDLMIGA